MQINEASIPETILPFLNEIADRLWQGRAAVMVGAGFSKNSSVEFPDWNKLGDIFYEKIYKMIKRIPTESS